MISMVVWHICRQGHAWQIKDYRADCATIEEGVARVCGAAYREIVLLQPVGHLPPFSNPGDDTHFLQWLKARWAGCAARLSRFPSEGPLPA